MGTNLDKPDGADQHALDTDAGLHRLGGSSGLYHAALTQLVSLLDLQLNAVPASALATAEYLQRLHGLAETLGAVKLQGQLARQAAAGTHDVGALLPCMRAVRAAALAWQQRHEGMDATVLPLASEVANPPSVLVIDDQPALIHAVRAVLKEQHQIYMATSGSDGLRSFRQQQPDLVLLDVEMPGLNGLEVARALRQLPGGASVPIIFVTSHHGSEEESACWEAGAVDFINKPINPLTLRNRVRAHLTMKRQADLLRRHAYIDGLTGMANRRCFDERLATELRRAQRDGSSLALLLADIDFFKRYNDHYGHPAGDECLRQVAKAFMASLERPADLAARIGGEEFAVLLPGTDLEGARQVAQRIGNAVRSLGLAHAGSEVAPCVTVSLGGICQPGGRHAGPGLVQLADEQLYRAKRSGRARSIVAALEDPSGEQRP